MDASSFLTASLRNLSWGERVSRILAASLQAVDPASAVQRVLQRKGDLISVEGRSYNLSNFKRIYLVGCGKAGAPMAHAVAGVLGDRLTHGIVIVKEGYAGQTTETAQLFILEAGHPLPDERGVQRTLRIRDLLKNSQTDDLVICVISGGGSALMTSPALGISLNDMQKLTSALLACGANINEINTLRKHLDTVKGGGLSQLAAPSPVITLILSDVVGDPLDVIASGPTVPDTTTFADAYEVLKKYDLLYQAPASVLAWLEKGMNNELPDTPKPGDAIFEGNQNVIIGSNHIAAEAALAQGEIEGFHTLFLTSYLQGEARHVGRVLASIARQVANSGEPIPRPACIVAGGETTVTVRGDGKGGRNQEMALGAVAELAELHNVVLVTLATDGGDGSTDAAGAVATYDTLNRARKIGLNPNDFLARNDAYQFFDKLDDLLKPGPTQTNVNDLTFIFAR